VTQRQRIGLALLIAATGVITNAITVHHQTMWIVGSIGFIVGFFMLTSD
jgi:allophanate hydrolase subunit 1